MSKEFGGARKRGRPEGAATNGNGGGYKKVKQEMESFSPGIGSKSKPCTKFFSTSGCQFGESCHFLHYVPGGIKAVTQMLGSNPSLPAGGRNNQMSAPSFPDGSPPAVKTRLCNKHMSAGGCKYGDKCHFAHGEWELGRPGLGQDDHRGAGPPMMPGRYSGRMESTPPGLSAASGFGASATAKISVDGSLAGAIIGKGGVNSKQICRMTGVKLAIRDNESDPNSKNIELEGTLDQIKQASDMVHELIMNVRGPPARNPGPRGPPAAATNNFKTKLCDNFTKGSCTFGDRCHFAHGEEELRSSAQS